MQFTFDTDSLRDKQYSYPCLPNYQPTSFLTEIKEICWQMRDPLRVFFDHGQWNTTDNKFMQMFNDYRLVFDSNSNLILHVIQLSDSIKQIS